MSDLNKPVIGIVGLGYVGLPLAVAFGRHYPTVGYDINSSRIAELRDGRDSSNETSPEELAASNNATYTDQVEELGGCNIYIITVPTPVDSFKKPDLSPLVSASETVGRLLGKDDIVIYESTVYPGCTEEVCVPVLEAESGLTFNRDFFVGYSPERINPGDKNNRLHNTIKVTSGSTAETAEKVDRLYSKVVEAGTHRVSSIRVAEAAKVIENTQRDINIALVNELALIFNKIGIDTLEVLEAAGSKWNFLPFRPGLVGGHCIGVDPYYLTYKAQEIGYHPEVILAGRRINDNMGGYVAGQVIKLMTRARLQIVDARILIMGMTFKENCPDTRNTRVIDIYQELSKYHARVDILDPWVNPADMKTHYGIAPIDAAEPGSYDAVIIAVGHRQFIDMGIDTIRGFCKPGGIIYDVKSILPKDHVNGRL